LSNSSTIKNAQHSVHFTGGSLRTPFGQSGTLHGLELFPVKWRYLILGEHRDGAQSRRIERVEITGTPEGAYPYKVLRKRKPLALFPSVHKG